MCDADVLKKLQVQFLTTATRWTNYGTKMEAASLGLPNLVCLLLSMGYSIRRIDSVSPDQASPLRNNQKGTRVIVTCNHSCQRFFLELPEEADQCKCLVKSDPNSQDSFWEVTATNSTSKNSSLIETGSGAVPAVSKELSTLIKNILIYLTHMIQGTLEDVEDSLGRSVTSLNNTSSPNKDAKRLSGYMKELVEPTIILSSPNGRNSAAICRSLDTLNQSADDIIPLPGLLTPKLPRVRESNISQSSPNINLFTKQEAVNSSGSTISDSQNEKVIQMLKRAISMLQTNKSQEVSPAIVPKQEAVDKKTASDSDFKEEKNTRLKSISSPSLLKKVKSSSTSKIAITPVENRRSGKSSSAKLPVKSNKVIIQAKSPMPGEVASGSSKIANNTRIICSKPRRVTNLYAHIKSTIPKASPTGNFVSKKT